MSKSAEDHTELPRTGQKWPYFPACRQPRACGGKSHHGHRTGEQKTKSFSRSVPGEVSDELGESTSILWLN